jgi:hypothetical protein
VVPLLVGGAMLESMMSSMTAMGAMQPAPPPAVPMKPKPPVLAAAPKPTAEAPKPPPVTEAPKPAPVAEAPKPVPPAALAESPAAAIETKQAQAPKPAPAIEPKRVESPKPQPNPVAAPSEAAPKPAAKPRPVAIAARPQPAPPPAQAPQHRTSSALKYNDLMTAVLYKDAEAVSELLRHGSWVDKPDSRGATPLMLAVELGDSRTAEALLKGGANASRALRVAQSRRDGPMLDLLHRYGAR